MTDASQPILVTGATGRHGGTSAYVVKALLDAGRSVRVLARSESERTHALAALGAEIVYGDFNNRKSLIAALDDVRTATFTYPVAGGILPAAATFAAAAKEIKHPLRVVVTSMAVAHPDSPSKLGQAQWLAEEVLSWAGLDLCVLRIAALYAENIVAMHAPSIKASSEFANSFRDAQVPWISGLDAARLVVAAVLKPDLFTGASVHYPPGAELCSHAEVASLLSAELGRLVRFNAATRAQWSADLIELSKSDEAAVINADMAQHIPAIGEALASSNAPVRPPNPAELQRLTGYEPVMMRQFLSENRTAFA